MKFFSTSRPAVMRPDPKLQLFLGVGFSLALLALLLALFLKPGLFHRQVVYHTEFSDVTGLKPGAEISYAGYPVGRVRAIEPDFAQGRFQVTLALDPDWVQPQGVVAQIDESNPLRPASIVLRRDPACPGAAEPGRITGCGRLPNVIDLAGKVVGDAGRIVETVSGMLAAGGDGPSDSKQMMARVQHILENIDGITTAVRELTDERRMATIGRAVDDLAATTAAARKTMENTTRIDPETINRTLASAERAVGAAADLLRDNSASLTAASTEAKYLLQTSAPSLQQILLNLDEATRNLADLSARLRDDPSMFIRGRSFKDPGETRANQ